MNMLDKLFSREIKRRTGAHTISIYIDENNTRRKKSRSRGRSAMEAALSGKTKVTTKKAKQSFFRRLDIRFPWLKLVTVIVIGVIAILDLCNLTISNTDYTTSKITIAPMSHHVRATERTLEGKKLVALTFDDGPSADTTPKLLDILRQKDVRATFFMLGNRAAANPDIVKQVESEWHEIGSHTMSHQNLIRLSASAVQSDINDANTVFKNILGHKPKFTRPPYGNVNDNVRKSVGTPMILWSVDTEDWKNKNTDSIVSIAMSQVRDGAIILMHDIHPTSVDAVPALIDSLRDAGYEFATISELTKSCGESPTPGNVYYNFCH